MPSREPQHVDDEKNDDDEADEIDDRVHEGPLNVGLPAAKELAAGSCKGWRGPSGLAIEPVVDLLARLIFGVSVALLDFAFELLTVPGNLLKVVVGELAPLLLELAGHLLPVTGDAIPIHDELRSVISDLQLA